MNLPSPRPFPLRFAAMLLASAAVCTPLAAEAQQGPPQPVAWSLALEPAPGHATAGGRLIAVITAAIDEGWHVYAPDEANAGPRPVELTIIKNPIFTAAGKFEAPEPEREMDEAFGQITSSYTDEVEFRLPVAVAASAAPGSHALEIDVSFQACDGSICLPAKNVRVKAIVTVKQ